MAEDLAERDSGRIGEGIERQQPLAVGLQGRVEVEFPSFDLLHHRDGVEEFRDAAAAKDRVALGLAEAGEHQAVCWSSTSATAIPPISQSRISSWTMASSLAGTVE